MLKLLGNWWTVQGRNKALVVGMAIALPLLILLPHPPIAVQSQTVANQTVENQTVVSQPTFSQPTFSQPTSSQPTFSQPTSSQTKDQSSFRISRLETEVRGLRSQLRQLESQLNRLQRTTQSNIDPSPPLLPSEAPPSSLEQVEPGADLLFDQLATLVIETRQDMFALQDQVAKLEQAIATGESP